MRREGPYYTVRTQLNGGVRRHAEELCHMHKRQLELNSLNFRSIGDCSRVISGNKNTYCTRGSFSADGCDLLNQPV
jgi:hypothetical protein